MNEDLEQRSNPLEFDDDEIEIVEVVGLEESYVDSETDASDADEVVLDFDEGESSATSDAEDAGSDGETVPRESFIRLRADFENYKKRTERERTGFEARATAGLVGRLLAVIDNFDRALAAGGDGSVGPFADGVGLIYRQLMDEMGKEGLQAIDALGDEFDPTKHEAVATEYVEADRVRKVLEVFQRGYCLKDRLLRPALVKVGVDRSDAAGDDPAAEEE
ncbi:MAG: nucleotide exchange factor GrpE [Planctomycetota bacterium]|nr:nucleotide exchange factor GrpE [Planctomycetota bacterium]